MSKMKFDRYTFMLDWKWFFILPTIAVTRHDQVFINNDVSITIHWLGWHFRWRWVEREGESE